MTPTEKKLQVEAMFRRWGQKGGGPIASMHIPYGMTEGLPDYFIMEGLSKREYIAARAMQGILSIRSVGFPEDLADECVRIADALIERLAK